MIKLLIVLTIFYYAVAFQNKFRPINTKMRMSMVDESITILARGFQLSPPLETRINDKIGKVISKLGFDVIGTNVVLRVHNAADNNFAANKPNSQIVEVTVSFKGGGVLHASERSEDMYASVDLISHKIAKSLKRHRAKYVDKRRKERKDFMKEEQTIAEQAVFDNFNEDELLAELEPKFKENMLPFKSASAEGVIRPKFFPMPPITVDEAIHQLDLIDHPFYVFRNKESNEINVVYRREQGGVGLIGPGK